jgi:two-component system sensor histidine kinase KdpD
MSMLTHGVAGLLPVLSTFLAWPGDALQPSPEGKRMRSALLDSISSDIGGRIALIVAAATSLKNRPANSLDAMPDEMVGIIKAEADELARFVPILLDMAKLACGAIDVREQPLVLSDLIRTVVEAAGTAPGVKVDTSLSDKLPRLRLDPIVLERALAILIESTARQAPEGSTVGVQAACDGDAVRIQVMDEGDGIAPGDLDGLFNQLHLPRDDERSSSYAGMRLAVCRGLIEAMDGTITAANRTDRSGAVFTITVPVPD